MRKRIAFTLIELLVVMAIIGVLWAILVPAIRQARAKAMTVKCIGNLKQIGIELAVAAEENQGRIYICSDTELANERVMSWASVLPAAKNQRLDTFVCPSHPPRHFDPTNRWERTYGICRPADLTATTLPRHFSRDGGTVYLHVNRVTDSSDFLLIADTTSDGYPGWWGAQYKFFLPDGGPRVHARHTGKACGLFMDSHAEPCDRKRLEGLGITAIYGPASTKQP